MESKECIKCNKSKTIDNFSIVKSKNTLLLTELLKMTLFFKKANHKHLIMTSQSKQMNFY
jgi:hypothetical protein